MKPKPSHVSIRATINSRLGQHGQNTTAPELDNSRPAANPGHSFLDCGLEKTSARHGNTGKTFLTSNRMRGIGRDKMDS